MIDGNYEIRDEINYFPDVTQIERAIIHRPDVYELTRVLGRKFNCKYVIDLGCGIGRKLASLHPDFEVFGVDIGENIRRCREFDFGTWLESDFENTDYLDIPVDQLARSVVVCSAVIEYLNNPCPLLSNLHRIMEHCPVAVISTPARTISSKNPIGSPHKIHHVREWSREELYSLLDFYSFNTVFSGYTANNNVDLRKRTILKVLGQNESILNPAKIPHQKISDDFNVVAIIPVYNESNILEQTLQHFVDQGIEFYIIDNWSTDNSIEIAKQFIGKGLVGWEKFPQSERPEYYQWEHILTRIQQLGGELDADWIILNDADVYRKTPWENIDLRRAIFMVDQAGYSAIDSTPITFRPVDNGFRAGDNPQSYFRYFEFCKKPCQFLQIKIWKKQKVAVNLADSGGHEVRFEHRKVFPFKFLHKHYPILSAEHGNRKILNERKPRYSPQEKRKGWHTHYEAFNKKEDFKWLGEDLILFNESFYQEYLVEMISGVGIIRDKPRFVIRKLKWVQKAMKSLWNLSISL